MRADVPLLASLLAASAAAQHNATSNSTTSIGNSYGNQKTVTELEAQVEALRKQLESAKQETCDAPSNPVTGGSGYSSGSGSGSSSGNQGSPAAPAESKPAGYSGEGASGNEASPAGSQAPSYDNSGKDSSAEGSDKPAAPATTEAPQSYPGAGSDNQGSNKGSSNEDSQQKAKSEGNYYAPMAPSSGAKSTSTVTIIVSADKTETRTVHQTQTQTLTNTVSGSAETGSADNSDVEIVTATETYCGKGPIPTAPGSGSNKGNASSALSSVISKASKASSDLSSVISSTRGYFGNGTAPYPTGASSGLLTTTRGAESLTTSNSVPAASGSIPAASNNATTHAFQTGTAASTATSSSASASATAKLSDCETFCQTLTNFNGYEVTPETCVQRTAGEKVDSASGQSSVGCAASFTPEVDLCQVTLNVKTSGTAETYMEVWLPNANETSWNGRSMNTDNGGLNGCVHYVDMQYVTGLGFAAIGDNAGHNGSSFDGSWTLNNNEAIIDWSYRARHAAVEIGKETISEFYSKKADYSYYVGCSAGGAQGIQSAEKYPNDFDGIIAGAAANDFNHLQGWSAHFRQLTGASDNDTFLTQADWITVQSYILDQCDEAIDGVADGILEDPTQCKFNVSAIPVCGSDSDSNCLTATQIQTVEDVFKPLYGVDGDLIYPALFHGAQVDAFKLGLLSGGIQGIAQDWFRGAVFNDSSFDITTLTKEDIARAVELDDLHGNPSAFSAQLGDFNAAGKKLMVYHGMADPMTSGGNAQRYYLKAAKELGMSNTELDDFYRLFRISGMAHCGVGGISGAGAWMFGQNGAAAAATNNIVSNLVDWVENNNAPETLLGTKFWYDTPSSGIMFERAHCRFPYRTVYQGGEDGDSTKPESWGCEMIENWQDCAGEFCSEDGSF